MRGLSDRLLRVLLLLLLVPTAPIVLDNDRALVIRQQWRWIRQDVHYPVVVPGVDGLARRRGLAAAAAGAADLDVVDERTGLLVARVAEQADVRLGLGQALVGLLLLLLLLVGLLLLLLVVATRDRERGGGLGGAGVRRRGRVVDL